MKSFELNVPRPADWFSQKNCALQYRKMLEEVEQQTPGGGSSRRKRGAADAASAAAGAPGGASGSGSSASGVTGSPTPAMLIREQRKQALIEELVSGMKVEEERMSLLRV